MRCVVLAALVFLAITSPAQATVPVPATYTVHAGTNPDCNDDPCADSSTNEIWLAGYHDRFTFQHELGHLYLDRMTGYWKRVVMARLKVPARSSWDGGCEDDDPCPAELAADAYATCALGWVSGGRVTGHGDNRRAGGHWESAYGYAPSRRAQRAMCSAIRRSARAWRIDPMIRR